jgi:hypothetical protein
LIDFSLSPKQKLPADHALHSLTKKEISDAVMAKINAMSVDKIQQIHDIIKNME